VALLLSLAAAACAPDRPPPPPGVLRVCQEQTAAWVRNFNPLSPASSGRWPTHSGIYEPLLVFNGVTSEYVPWLAVSHEWGPGNRVLRLRLRDGVRWSDGEPFSARDVVFTFRLLREFPGLDGRGLWSFLEDVEEVGGNTVEFRFARVFVPGFDEIAAQRVVPEHIWKDVENPVTFANEHPVATGPFTEVRVFRSQVWELGRNPDYWQEGVPRIDVLRFPAYPSNDRANLALVFDELDWAGNFIPAIDRVFVERDPEAHAYWFPLTGSCIFLYANTLRSPLDGVEIRKALSRAVDRDLLVDVALYRYSRPADATGLSDGYSAWRDPEAVTAGDWVGFDPEAANAALDAAGLVRDEEGWRRLPDGEPWTCELLTVSGWSDWVRASQVIARGLRGVGIRTTVKTADFAAWFQRVQKGEFDLSLGWSFDGPTPYLFYRWLMSSATAKPVGETSHGNWHRYGSAAADSALAAFEREADPAEQKRIGHRLQRIFVDEAPAIPLYPNPSWAEYNRGRFRGFPSADDPYADPSPNKFDRGDCLLVLTTLVPRD